MGEQEKGRRRRRAGEGEQETESRGRREEGGGGHLLDRRGELLGEDGDESILADDVGCDADALVEAHQVRRRVRVRTRAVRLETSAHERDGRALAICASLCTKLSTSFPATIIKSAISSITTTMKGIFSSFISIFSKIGILVSESIPV